MTTLEQWTANLQRWLARHPLKNPPAGVQADYTREVMRRIRLAEAPAPVYRWAPQRVWRPRMVFAMATVAACALVAIVMIPGRQAQVARQVERDVTVLASLEDAVTDVVPPSDDEIAEELAMLDELMMLAQQTPAADDEAWIEQTLKIFEQLDNGAPLDDLLPDSAESDEELLEQLEQLEHAQASATS